MNFSGKASIWWISAISALFLGCTKDVEKSPAGNSAATLQEGSAPSQASEVCLASAKAWSIQSESKHTATQADEITDSETKFLGSGANLFLVSVFVEGPKTGENTHWEVVGEYNYNTQVCEIITGRRYWEH